VIIDIHVYAASGHGTPESSASALEMIKEAQDKKLDGIALIQKNRVWRPEELESLNAASPGENFCILTGQEIESPVGPLLIFGVNEDLADTQSYLETLRRVHSKNGSVILVCASTKDGFTRKVNEDYVTVFSSFDGVEILNETLPAEEMREGLEAHRKLNFCALAGSRAHRKEDVGCYATKFRHVIRTDRDLIRAIKMKLARPCVPAGNDIDSRGGDRNALLWKTPKAALMGCEGLLFDLYGTLVNLKSFESYEEFHKMAQWLQMEGINVHGPQLYDFYMRRANELYRYGQEKISFPEVDILRVFREAINHFSGSDLGEEFARRAALVFRALTIRSIKLYGHTRKVLRELRRRGYRMGIISNGQAAFTIPEIEDLKLQRFFDFVILSSDVGCSKPERRIFEMAATQLETPHERTAMIGDDLHGDIFAAQRAGLRTVYIRSDVATSPYPVEPDVTLTNGDLRNLLRVFP
jgi:putative hydrolase of the HAD superfamily